MTSQTNKRKQHLGNDIFREIPLPDNSGVWAVSYWDLWFLVVLLNEFIGEWSEMIAYFRQKIGDGSSRYNAEPKLSHIYHLQEMIQRSRLEATAVLGKEAVTLLKTEKRSAANKILKHDPPRNDKSEWMIQTPRRVGEANALRGRWPCFSVSPETYAEPLAALFKTRGYYEEDETFDLERKLSAFLDQKEQNADVPHLAALYRAFLTVMLEKIEMVDDSYGNIGDLYGDVFSGYLELPRLEMELPSADFLQDILELMLWEDYGFTADYPPTFFASLTPEEASLAETFLRTRQPELAEVDLTYQAEKAYTLLALLVTEQAWYAQFTPLAQALGTQQWQRITRLAEKAEASGQLDLATAVYTAALLTPGMHHNYLHQKHEELQTKMR